MYYNLFSVNCRRIRPSYGTVSQRRQIYHVQYLLQKNFGDMGYPCVYRTVRFTFFWHQWPDPIRIGNWLASLECSGHIFVYVHKI